MFKKALMLVLAGVLLSACSQSKQITTGTDAELIKVSKAWLRETPPQAEVGAGYLQLNNAGARDVSLVGLETNVANKTEVHSVSMANGMMQMRKIAALEIPAQGQAELSPGGNHMMLMGLKQPLIDGQTVSVILRFADGSNQTVEFSVRGPGKP